MKNVIVWQVYANGSAEVESGWGKRGMADMSEMGRDDMRWGWGKRSLHDVVSAWGKRAPQKIQAAWGKRTPDIQDMLQVRP